MTIKSSETCQISQRAVNDLPSVFQDKKLDARQQTNNAIAWMRENKCMAIVAPSSHGGLDASLSEVCNLLASISSLSGSLGLIYAMHLSQALSLVNHRNDNKYLNSYVKELSESQLLIASATSEKGSGGGIFTSTCQIEERGEKLHLLKEVPNISYVDLADSLLVTARHHTEEKRQVLALIRQEHSVLSPGFTGSFVGMKGIFNASYTIEANFSEEAIFDENFPAIARSTMTAATQLMWAAVWSGIAQSAIEKSRIFIKKELKNSPETANQMNFVLTDLLNKKFTLNSLIAASISEYNQSGEEQVGLQASARINRLKIIASQLVNEICYGALSICGLRGYSLSGPYSLADEIGDALSAPLMVSNYRLLANNASVERFVDEDLSLR